MTAEAARAAPARRNLLVFHLESIGWQALRSFPEAFPHLTALMAQARTYRAHVAAATSTQMVMAAFLHGNDCEMDAAAGIERPAGNQPSLFRLLDAAGYHTTFLCATARADKAILAALRDSLPPLWATDDFGALLRRFEAAIAERPFGVYAWSLVPHVEANLALSAHARSLDELFAGACAVTDTLLGGLLELLRRQDCLSDTTIVVYGDHGDDFWTHGFKTGMLHGIEPYTSLIRTPLVICDPRLPVGTDRRLVGTVDLAPTCLELLDLPPAPSFSPSGRSLLRPDSRRVAFAQNYTANQPDTPWRDVRKSFTAVDQSHALLVSARGLALYNHRLDPGNHANLLHFFELDGDARLSPATLPAELHFHFHTPRHLWRGGALQDSFDSLRAALLEHVAAKNDYVAARTEGPRDTLDLGAFRRLDRQGREAFFNRSAAPPPQGEQQPPAPAAPAAPAVPLAAARPSVYRDLLRRAASGVRAWRR